ncbi:MAG: Gmad2 immunoglobulin-like domain-containing protein [Patescibacteria group bacterium]|jgi:hypothetical protein
MKKQTIITLIITLISIPILIVALLALGMYFYAKNHVEDVVVTVTNFEECAATGSAIMESYPRQCSYNGVTYAEDIGNALEQEDTIRVSNISPNQVITSPVSIYGEARGTWFFEASFPIIIEDAQGKVVGSGLATAQSDWMTENFVPFTASIIFNDPETSRGTLFLRKDNPSGLPENDDVLEIPIFFN